MNDVHRIIKGIAYVFFGETHTSYCCVLMRKKFVTIYFLKTRTRFFVFHRHRWYGFERIFFFADDFLRIKQMIKTNVSDG